MAVLAVTSSQPDRERLQAIADREGWDFLCASDFHSALSELGRRNIPVILCDRDLPEQNWRDSIRTLLAAVRQPCVILTSSVNDSYLWQEVIQHGGYDVLPKPFHEEQVISTIRRAWLFWKAGHPR